MSHAWDFFLVPYASSLRDLSLALHLEREKQRLQFRFTLQGEAVNQIERSGTAGDVTSGQRLDELWKTTCFEFFLGEPDRKSYFEINVSLNGDWNAYAFLDYRAGMERAGGVRRSPLREVRSSDNTLEILGEMGLDDFPLLGPVVLGATAVLQYQDGSKEYWAIAHEGDKPDFHVRSSFIAQV